MQGEGGDYDLDTVPLRLSWMLSTVPRSDLAAERLGPLTPTVTPTLTPTSPHRDAFLHRQVLATPRRSPLTLSSRLATSQDPERERDRSRDRQPGATTTARTHTPSSSNDNNTIANTSNHREQPLCLNAHVSRLLLRFWTDGAASDIDDAILLGRTVLALSPRGHHRHDVALRNLSGTLHVRFWQGGALADLEEAVEIARMAVEASPIGHLERAAALNDLGVALCEWFWSTSAIAPANSGMGTGMDTDDSASAVSELDEGIELYRTALELCEPEHSQRGTVLSHLGASLCMRFRCLKAVRDLTEAILLGEKALPLHGHDDPGLPSALNNIARSYHMKFMLERLTDDLNKAIMFQREAVDKALPHHPHLSMFRANLAACHEVRYRMLNAVLEDLNDAVTLLKAAVNQQPPKHAMRVAYLRELGNVLQLRFKKTNQRADIDEAISHLCNALKFPLGRAERSLLLDKLADSYQGRFNVQHTLDDLEVAIQHRREALALSPPGHRGRSTHLNKLATVLRGRFKRLDTLADLDESIRLHRAALDLRLPGHPGRIQSLHGLLKSLELRYKEQGLTSDYEQATALKQMLDREALHMTPAPGVQPEVSRSRSQTLDSIVHTHVYMHIAPAQMKEVIRDVVLEAFAHRPPRLLETKTGFLCDRGVQIPSFEASTAYAALLAMLETCSAGEEIGHIRATVKEYFRYATLSHRWGAKEVSLREVGRRSIFEMEPVSDGLVKLQKFCQTAAGWGYVWAWSDTCCIDKDSAAELQEAIGSMFKWYRQSALTIVHLADVADNPPNTQGGRPGASSEADRLARSRWWKRGWTLQELLAPPVLLFYTCGWKLYHDETCTNHKEDPEVLRELVRAARIPERQLSAFEPGSDGNALARLQWAAGRETTRLEDTAYSLCGVFDLALYVSYGEGADRALGRLLQEIVAQSGDTSVLDWVGVRPSTFNSAFPANLQAYHTVPNPISSPELPSPSSSSVSSASSVSSGSKIEAFITQYRHVLSPSPMRALYDRLGRAPPPSFSSRHLMLPCIVYAVYRIVPRSVPRDVFLYDLQAPGLRSVCVMSEDRLDVGHGEEGGAARYVLVRVWERRWLVDTSVGVDGEAGGAGGMDLSPTRAMMATSTAAARLVMRLAEPFRALLLVRLPHGEYRRIASGNSIIARADNMASILDYELRTLEIV